MTEEQEKYETKPMTNAHKVRSQVQIKAKKTYAKKKANEKDFSNEVYTNIRILILLLIFATLIPLFAFFGFYKPDSDEIGEWFQRSGSLVIIVVVIAEIFNSKLNTYPALSWGFKIMKYEDTSNKVKNTVIKVHYLRRFEVFVAFVGTLIWGYDDIMHSWAMNYL